MKFLTVFLCLILFACGSAKEEATEVEDKETVFDPLVETIDKAKEVEDVVMQQKQQMDDALREAEGESDDSKP